jgi:hypothetical protein
VGKKLSTEREHKTHTARKEKNKQRKNETKWSLLWSTKQMLSKSFRLNFTASLCEWNFPTHLPHSQQWVKHKAFFKQSQGFTKNTQTLAVTQT